MISLPKQHIRQCTSSTVKQHQLCYLSGIEILFLRCDLENFDLKSIGQQFDVILIEPPLEEYARSYGVTNTKFWEWEKIMALDIGAV